MPITPTPNLGLSKQDQGDEDWHIPLNATLDILDFFFVFPLSYNPTTKEVTVERTACYGGGTGAEKLAASGTEFICASGLSVPQDSSIDAEANVQILIPRSGDLSNLYVFLSTAPGVGKSRTFTLRRNGVDTAVVVVISDTDVDGADILNFGAVSAGDRITIQCTSTGSPALSEVAFGWELRYAQSTS